LHLHRIGTYGPNQNRSAPLGWHRDFSDARERLRDWVAVFGIRLDHDQPTRQTYWRGEQPIAEPSETVIVNRDEDFVQFVAEDVSRRRQAEGAFEAQVDTP
jgi:hypothetical protein